jgi:hypothetical protein
MKAQTFEQPCKNQHLSAMVSEWRNGLAGALVEEPARSMSGLLT